MIGLNNTNYFIHNAQFDGSHFFLEARIDQTINNLDSFSKTGVKMIFHTVIRSVSMQKYLPGSSREIAAHLFPH